MSGYVQGSGRYQKQNTTATAVQHEAILWLHFKTDATDPREGDCCATPTVLKDATARDLSKAAPWIWGATAVTSAIRTFQQYVGVLDINITGMLLLRAAGIACATSWARHGASVLHVVDTACCTVKITAAFKPDTTANVVLCRSNNRLTREWSLEGPLLPSPELLLV